MFSTLFSSASSTSSVIYSLLARYAKALSERQEAVRWIEKEGGNAYAPQQLLSNSAAKVLVDKEDGDYGLLRSMCGHADNYLWRAKCIGKVMNN